MVFPRMSNFRVFWFFCSSCHGNFRVENFSKSMILRHLCAKIGHYHDFRVKRVILSIFAIMAILVTFS